MEKAVVYARYSSHNQSEQSIEVILNYSGDGNVLTIENIEKAHNSVRPCALNQELTKSKRTLVIENIVLIEIPI